MLQTPLSPRAGSSAPRNAQVEPTLLGTGLGKAWKSFSPGGRAGEGVTARTCPAFGAQEFRLRVPCERQEGQGLMPGQSHGGSGMARQRGHHGSAGAVLGTGSERWKCREQPLPSPGAHPGAPPSITATPRASPLPAGMYFRYFLRKARGRITPKHPGQGCAEPRHPGQAPVPERGARLPPSGERRGPRASPAPTNTPGCCTRLLH